jgi:N-acetylglucosaminyldiphosphoundecaprenol N-acetyl-beta-D-mannosaminyltransferase
MLSRVLAPEGAFRQQTLVGGVRIDALTLEETAELMIDFALGAPRAKGPYFLTSANGEVVARSFCDPNFAALLNTADLISADGQSLVFASRLMSNRKLPERVATTDLYPAVAKRAERVGVSFYLFGAKEEVSRSAYEATRDAFPNLEIKGRSHGYLSGLALDQEVEKINALAPDILWVSLGAPLEQEFVARYAERMPSVKLIKTSGGLLDFVSGGKRRAPVWMQRAGLEWAFRLMLEPRRLSGRYLASNPLALLLFLLRTQ